MQIHPLLQQDEYQWRQLEALIEGQENHYDSEFKGDIERLAIASSYALEQLCRDPELLPRLQGLNSFDLEDRAFTLSCNATQDLVVGRQLLRQFRHRKLVEIIYLDVIKQSPLPQTLIHLSDLADLLIRCALQISEQHLITKHGQPSNPDGEPMGLNIIAMGKLGGRELNFSSDIDLICCFDSDGELSGYGKLSHQEFFSRVVRLFSQLLNDQTEDGFVYRVDLRLRPWGESGPAALSHAALEHYYQLHGREWEQYAMVKARVLSGDKSDLLYLNGMLKSFVYRKYHDYRVFEGLAQLKDKIDLQAKAGRMRDNIKLGPGGIREIEFFVQAFQILKGGRNKQLQNTQILSCFEVLQQQDIIPESTITELRAAYVFLRQLENKLQMLSDQQTHSCPSDALLQRRIASALGMTDWQAVMQKLHEHEGKVSKHFTDLFKRDEPAGPEIIIADTIGDEKLDALQIAFIRNLGLDEPERVNLRLAEFFRAKTWGYMSARAKQRFSNLLPDLIKKLEFSNQQLVLLERLLNLFSSIAGRSVYFELLYQNNQLLEKLVELFDKSEWIAQEVARYPMLLEQLIQAGDASSRFDKANLQANLQNQLNNVRDDLELELDILRLFKREQSIVIAMAELSEQISTTEVSRYLSELAEVLLDAVYRLASKAVQGQFGLPECIVDGERRQATFAIIALGKLGSREMHYQSDLDIIFLHDSSGDGQVSSGPRSLDNSVYFARLAQKIISLASLHTGSGKLYEIDSRLRPQGSAGLLVSSAQAYLQYQLSKAWTWEHQALVRARQVAGDATLGVDFDALRRQVLGIERDQQRLANDVVEMRRKLYDNKRPVEGDVVNLKHSHGTLVDIEFMVQYWTLLNANKVGSICSYSDNIGLLNELYQLRLISKPQSQLIDIYTTYHRWLHVTVLQNKPAEIASELIAVELEFVKKCWAQCFGLDPASKHENVARDE